MTLYVMAAGLLLAIVAIVVAVVLMRRQNIHDAEFLNELRNIEGRFRSSLQEMADLTEDNNTTIGASAKGVRETDNLSEILAELNTRVLEIRGGIRELAEQSLRATQQLATVAAAARQIQEVLDGEHMRPVELAGRLDRVEAALASAPQLDRDYSDLIALARSTQELIGSLSAVSQRQGHQISDMQGQVRQLAHQLSEPQGTLAATEAAVDQPERDVGENDSDGDTAVPAGDVNNTGVPGAESQSGTGSETRQIEPVNRGGGRTQSDEQSADRKVGEALSEKPSQPRGYLVARHDRERWQAFVEVDADGDVSVLQDDDGTALRQIDHFLFGPLANLASPIRVIGNGVSGNPNLTSTSLILGKGPPYLFRLIGSDRARATTQISRGLILIVVPDSWEYDAERSGTPPLQAEPFGVSGYTAHFFSAHRSQILAFARKDEEPFELTAGRPDFRFEGDRLEDAEERMGPLFIGEPPRLTADEDAFLRVKTIVVGGGGAR